MILSVIIPFHKEISLIRRAVDSIVENFNEIQSIEILICNDGDFTEAQIRSNISDTSNSVVKVLKNTYSKGPGGARNTGLDSSSGELIAFLDADDYWLPGKITEQLKSIRQGATFIATGYRFDSKQSAITPPNVINNSLEIFLRRGIGTSTVLVTRDLVGQTRFKDIRFAQDIDFWFTLAKSPEFRYSRVCQELVVYSTSGSTRNKWEQLRYLNKVLDINEIGLMNRTRILISYVIYGIYNHYIKRF